MQLTALEGYAKSGTDSQGIFHFISLHCAGDRTLNPKDGQILVCSEEKMADSARNAVATV